LALLDQSARISAPATSAQNLAYLRGDQSREGADGLRIRDSLLGDVVNSSPFYVSATDTLYVGANDGMLHAFNADTGNELFAYVPGGVSAAELGKLSDPYYVHRYFVDGPVVVTSQRQTPGKSYLVGALGRGGKKPVRVGCHQSRDLRRQQGVVGDGWHDRRRSGFRAERAASGSAAGRHRCRHRRQRLQQHQR
jgi:Tfp pilus tip-associated adhesin PilY1